MRTLVVGCLIVVIFVVSTLVAVHRRGDAGEPPASIVHIVDPRGDVERSAPTTTIATPTIAKPAARARTAPSERCGGDLPPCSVMMRESRGNIHAFNPTGCGGRGCRGKWQCDPRTCTGTGTEQQQDDEARALWANGAGCLHWAAC